MEENNITEDIIDKFKKYALSKEKMYSKKTMTIRLYLKLFRTAYDAFPDRLSKSVSNFFVYNYKKGLEQGDIEIFARSDWNSVDDFENLKGIYHREELWFGGPRLYINKKKTKWNCNLYMQGFRKEDAAEIILIYVRLRDKGYPVYCMDYEKVLDTLINGNG